MITDRRTAAWAAKYKELLQGLTHALGDNPPPAKLAICRTAAILQTELSTLGDQFASGAGASADDLNTFMKISATIGGLLQSIGLDQVLQKPPIEQNGVAGARAELQQLFDRIAARRDLEESKGVYRDREGNVLDSVGHVQGCECMPCRWRRSVTDEEADAAAEWRKRFTRVATPQPPNRAEPAPIVKVPPTLPPELKLVEPAEPPARAADTLTHAQLKERAKQPSFPQPASIEPDTTQRFLEWSARGGSGWLANLPGRLP
jgi:hypothetical protein